MNTAKIFDEKAKEMDKHPIMNEIARVFAGQVMQNISLTADMDLLDFGCGTGLVGMQLYPHVRSITMTDTSKGMLDILRDKIERNNIRNMSVYNSDIFAPAFEAGRFDLAYVLNVLHHVPDVPGLLSRFHYLLKPGSYLLIGDLEPEDGSFHEEAFETHHGFDASEMSLMLEKAGFAVSQSCRMYTIKKPDKNGQLREYPLFFLAAQRK